MLSGGRERYIDVEEVNAELFQKTLVQFYGKDYVLSIGHS